MVLEELNNHMPQNKNISPLTNVNSICIENLKISLGSMKILEEKIREKPHWHQSWQ
jgi:hypothetical protein